MAFQRVPITRVEIHQDRSGWHAKAYDARGDLRSAVNAPDRAYVDRKIAEFWPEVPVVPRPAPPAASLANVIALGPTKTKAPRKGRGLSREKKEHYFRILDQVFGSPASQRQHFPNVDAAAMSAATLLAARAGGKVKYQTMIDLVKEWYWKHV